MRESEFTGEESTFGGYPKKKYHEYRENYSLKQKKNITKKILNYTREDVKNDYQKLVEIGCLARKLSATSLVGNKVSDYYTFFERLNTRGNKGISYYELWKNKRHFTNKKYVNNFLKAERKSHPLFSEQRVWYSLARFYFGSIQQFKPLIAMEYFCKYKPTCVLDPTCGWFGRGIACAALNISKYIAFDTNVRLKKPYRELIEFLKREGKTETEFDVSIKDATKVDYSKYDYDMVFTSPPYYNIERYSGQPERTEEKWNTDFYEPLVRETWKYLKNGGHYILIVPRKLGEYICDIIGKRPFSRHPFKKIDKNRSEKMVGEKKEENKEYVYVWKK